ncbi:MAG: hypothetical protein NTX64_15735 [Elusimicrobia bacterium]|nr:hypothetical protein [Elusimicrobiota bacterium]
MPKGPAKAGDRSDAATAGSAPAGETAVAVEAARGFLTPGKTCPADLRPASAGLELRSFHQFQNMKAGTARATARISQPIAPLPLMAALRSGPPTRW